MNEQFRAYLTGQLIKKIDYNPSSNKLIVEPGENKAAMAALYHEGEHQYSYNQEQVNEFIMQVIAEGITLSSTSYQEISIIPRDIRLGQHIKLFYQGQSGRVEDELFKVGKNEFMLIQHTRDSLIAGTILNAKSSPWSQGAELIFEFQTEGKIGLYRTGKIQNIEFLGPNDIYRAIEDRKEVVKEPIVEDISYMKVNDKIKENEGSFYYPNTKNPKILVPELFNRMPDADSLFLIRIQGDVLYLRLLNLEKKEVLKLFFQKNDILAPIFKMQGKDETNINRIQTITPAKFEQKNGSWKIVNKGGIQFKGK